MLITQGRQKNLFDLKDIVLQLHVSINNTFYFYLFTISNFINPYVNEHYLSLSRLISEIRNYVETIHQSIPLSGFFIQMFTSKTVHNLSRNCLFYLRDKEPEALQKLLKVIIFDMDRDRYFLDICCQGRKTNVHN